MKKRKKRTALSMDSQNFKDFIEKFPKDELYYKFEDGIHYLDLYCFWRVLICYGYKYRFLNYRDVFLLFFKEGILGFPILSDYEVAQLLDYPEKKISYARGKLKAKLNLYIKELKELGLLPTGKVKLVITPKSAHIFT